MSKTAQEVTAENGSPTKQISPSKKTIDDTKQAYNLLAQGKRHLLVGDVQSAVNALQESCSILAKEFGETAVECGESYVAYATALLEMARIESGVLGNALDGVPEGEDANNSQVEDPETLSEDQKDDVRNKVDDALMENYVKTTNGNTKESKETNGDSHNDEKNKEESTDVEMKEQDNEKKEEIKTNGTADIEMTDADDSKKEQSEEELKKTDSETKSSEDTEAENGKNEDPETPEEQEGEEEGEDGSEEQSQEEDAPEQDEAQDGEKTDEEDDVTNLQLAWEMFELSKVIYEKHQPENTAKIAHILLKLGEVGLENENYEQSVADIQACLDIQTKTLEPDDRCLAETHYQLGVAHSYTDNFDASMESFKNAAEVITNRMGSLVAKIKEKEFWTEEKMKEEAAKRKDPFYSEEKEIEELKGLLPEIKEKINDMEQMKKDSKERMAKAKEAAFASMLGGSSSGSSPFGASTSKEADNITALSSSSQSTATPLNINHLVRKKRKNDDETVASDAKKTKLENGVGKTQSPVANGLKEKVENSSEPAKTEAV